MAEVFFLLSLAEVEDGAAVAGALVEAALVVLVVEAVAAAVQAEVGNYNTLIKFNIQMLMFK